MKPPSTDHPTQAQLLFPVMEALEEFGGSAPAADVAESLADRFLLSEDVRNRRTVTADGQIVNIWRRHVRYARQKLKDAGFVTSSGRGASWTLTDVGHRSLKEATTAIVVEVLQDEHGSAIGARINFACGVPTSHLLAVGDARDLRWIGQNEIPLVLTSIPYFDLKNYGSSAGQLADLPSYEAFLAALDDVWRECYRVLIPGGRMALNVGDPLRSRKAFKTHHVLPLHADILARSTRLGFHALTGIVWEKIGNITREVGGNGMLGQPYQPNCVVGAGLEHILLLRKPGAYRKTTPEQRRESALTKEEFGAWFRPIWRDVPGARATGAHPAPFPIEIPYRIMRMFSFKNDLCLDPFGGSGTTAIAAAQAGRNSICVDVEPGYVRDSIDRVSRYDLATAA